MAEVSPQTSWTRLKDLYFAASELTGSQRQLFVDQNCPPGDPLREELVRLLHEADRADGALDVPIHTTVLPPAASSLPPDACLNHYKIVDLVARGGLGVVYRATDVRLKRTVAIKVLRWETIRDGGRERFIREAEIAASLTHPNIIAIYDIGTADGVDYIAMEYAAGRTVRELITAGPIELSTVLTIARQIADALAALHGVGIIHRDVKPTNVVVTRSGLVKVLDFGLAKAVFPRAVEGFGTERDQLELSKSGMIMGTFAYMSPEQAEGKSVDARSDIFSFGALLYEMLTGCAPFTAKTDLGVLSAVLHASPRPIHESAPHVPPDVERLVFECLHKNPADRWHRMVDVKVALDHLLAGPSSAQTSPAVVATRLRVRPSIAVLPFANMSAAEDTEYFADGLTEELINALSRLEGLRVVSRTSAFEFKGKAMNIRRVGSQLGVSTVLEGSVRKSGDRLRITAQLAKVTDGCQLWAGRFDRQMTDVFEIQDEIAQTIAKTLEIALRDGEGAPLVKRYTTDFEAYHLYLRGRFHWNKRSAAGFEKAREYFEAALERDAHFAPAHAGLADYHVSVASWGLAPPEIAWPQAKAAAMKAVSIDPALAEAHIALAAYRTYYERNWAEGEREFRLARQLNPMDANVCTQFGTYLIQRGRFDDASVVIRRAADIDPLSATVNTCLAGVAYYSRHYDRAIEICRQALEIVPDDIELVGVLGMSYEAKGCLDDALTAYRTACSLSQDHPMLLALLAGATAKAGRQEDAETLMRRLDFLASQGYVPPIAWGWVHTALGDFDAAFDWFEKAVDAHDVMLAYLVVGPCYDPLRSHPRFPHLLERIGARATDDVTSHERTAVSEATRRINRV